MYVGIGVGWKIILFQDGVTLYEDIEAVYQRGKVYERICSSDLCSSFRAPTSAYEMMGSSARLRRAGLMPALGCHLVPTTPALHRNLGLLIIDLA